MLPALRANNMKNYEDYEITTTVQTVDSNVYMATKRNAETYNGLSFNHMFYFQKTNAEKANCIVNGMPAIEFKPNFNDNHYYAFVKGGIVRSLDMTSFYFEKEGLGYVNRISIPADELLKMTNKNC